MASNILNSPFPAPQGERKEFLYALFTGIFVGGFLVIFTPFGMEESEQWKTTRIAGFGFVTFFCLLIIYFVLPKLFPRFFEEATYTVGKDLIMAVITIVIIGAGNTWYISLWQEIGIANMLGMIWNTFLIGIFPLAFITLIQHMILLKRHVQDSNEINNAAVSNLPVDSIPSPKVEQIKVHILAENESVEIPFEDLFFIESVGNYANVVQKSNGSISRNLYRTTLKSIEAANQLKGLVRCHRSYIVNLDQVKAVNGNAQGLKLTLKDSAEIVPVSRKYVPLVKSYFA